MGGGTYPQGRGQTGEPSTMKRFSMLAAALAALFLASQVFADSHGSRSKDNRTDDAKVTQE